MGALVAPGAAPRFLGGGLQRYGDKAQIWLDGPSQVQRGALLGSLANLLWGPGATPFSRADPLLRFYLQQLVPAQAALRAGLPPPLRGGLGSGEGGSPAVLAVRAALGRLSPQAGCALLAGLHHLDAQGQRTDTAVMAAVARAEGGTA